MPQPQPEFVDVPIHLLVEPVWAKSSHYRNDEKGRRHLEGAKFVKATVNRPNVARGGVVTKVTLRIPSGAFLPLEPHAVVVVSMEDLDTVVVHADAPEPSDEVSE